MDLSEIVAPTGERKRPYWEVLDAYHKANAQLPVEMQGVDVPAFAQVMNKVTGSQDFQEGLGTGNALRRGSANVDIALHHFGGAAPGWTGPTLSGTLGGPREGVDLPAATGGLAQKVAAFFGANPKLQAKVEGFGESIPRMAVDLGAGGALAGVPGIAAMSAFSTYGETGRALPAAISGGSAFLFPKVAEAAGQGALRALGAPTLGEVLGKETPKVLEAAKLLPSSETEPLLTRLVPDSLVQNVAQQGARQVGMAGVGLGTEAAQILTRPEGWDEKFGELKEMFTPSSLVVTGLNQLPWAAVDIAHERGGPAKRFAADVVPAVKAEFARRFSTAFEKEYGQPPTTEQIDRGASVAMGKTPAPAPKSTVPDTGKVLASMGEAPVQFDTKRPVKTSEGEWNVLEAVDQTKSVANRIAAGRDTPTNLTGKHDLTVATALRDIEASSGGKLSKDELTHQAAMRAIDIVERDAEMVGRVSPEFAQLERSEQDREAKDAKDKEVEQEITRRITSGSPDFDAGVATRIALVSGEPDKHWIDAGLPSATGQDGADHALPVMVSARDKTDSNKTFPLETNILQHIQSFPTQDQITGKMVLPNPLTADATFAARKAALVYDKPFNANDPNSVRDFYEFVRASVRRAQIDWQRIRSGSSVVSDHPTFEEAQTTANELKAAAKAEKSTDQFRVVKSGDKYNVVKQTFFSTYSREQMEAVRQEQELTPVEQTLADVTEGIPKPTLDVFGETMKEFEQNQVLEQMKRYESEVDPGTREGRKAAFAQTVIDFLTSLPSSKLEGALLGEQSAFTESGRRRSFRNVEQARARFIKFVQYLRDGGDINLRTVRQDDGSLKVVADGDVHAMNEYFGALGYDTTKSNKTPFVDDRTQGMNFFEQFHVLSKLLQQEIADPRWTDQRPKGDFGFLPGRFARQAVDTITYDPPERGGWATRSTNMWKDVPDTVEGTVLKMRDTNGKEVRLEGGKNPLMTAILEGTKRKLTLTAGQFVGLLNEHGHDLDPNLVKLATALTYTPFGKNVPIGFGIAKDTGSKGYYHYLNDLVTGTGILLSPYSDSVKASAVRKLDNPKDILPHFVHELTHAHTVFAYHNDPELKRVVDETHAYLKDKHDFMLEVSRGTGFQVDAQYALTSPEEMLAGVVNDGKFQQWLKSQKDTLPPLPGVQSVGTLWDRIMSVLKRTFDRMFGADASGTMLERVGQLSQEVIARQEAMRRRLGLTHEGNIYEALERDKLLEPGSDLVQGLSPDVWAPAKQERLDYPWLEAPAEQLQSDYREAVAYRQMRESVLTDFRNDAEQYDPATVTEWLPKLEASVNGATVHEQALKAALERKGQPTVLESRVNPLGIVDSLKSYSDEVIDDGPRYWFKPIDPVHFMATFGASLGDRWNFQKRNGVWGYEIPKVVLDNVTPADFANMPQPQVRPWAPSSFETLKAVLKKANYNDQDAESLAGWGMKFASVLRNDETMYGVLGPNKTQLGLAWLPERVVGLNPRASNPVTQGRVLAHEATHTWGAHYTPELEAPFVREAMDVVQEQFHSLSIDERTTLIQGLTRLTDTSMGMHYAGDYYQQAVNSPQEFIAEFMSHTADILSKVPKPSAYLEEALRAVPDDISNLLQRVTLARAQGLDALKESTKTVATQYSAIENTKRINATVDELSNTFKSLAKTATQIANDQAEFYRMRFMYPDMYQSQLNNVEQTLSETRERGDVLAGQILQSRVNPFPWVKQQLGLEPKEGEDKPSLWLRTITQFSQFAKQFPVARPFYDMLASAQGLERLATVQMTTALAGNFTGGKLVDDQRTRQLVTFAKAQPLRDVFSKIALDIQTAGDEVFRRRLSAAEGDVFAVEPVNIATPERMTALYDKYKVSAADRPVLDTIFEGTRNQIKLASTKIFEAQLGKVEGIAAIALAKHTDLRPEEARKLAKMLSQSWEAMDQGDIVTASNLQADFAARVPDLKVQQRLAELVNDGRERAKKLERFLSVRMPYFMSERRFGDYGVWWRDEGSTELKSFYFKTTEQRQKFITSKSIEPIRLTDADDKSYGLGQEFFGALEEVNAKISEKLEGLFGSEEGKRLSLLLDSATELRDALNARDVLKASSPRRQASTREFLDMFDSHQNYVQSVVGAAKRSQMRIEGELLLTAPEFATQPMMKNLLNTHLNNVMAPDTELGRAIQTVNFTYFMGFNMSNMILEPFQQISALAPLLTENGTSVAGSYKLLAKANQMWLKSKQKGGRFDDAELNEAMTRARNEGVVDQGIYAELDHNADLQTINRIRAAGGLNMLSPFEMVKNRLYQVAALARRFYGVVPAYNSEIAFVAAHLLGKSKGLSGDELFEHNRFISANSMFGGGKINRPIGLFAMNDSYGVGRTAAQTMWSLQSYSSSMITMMGQLVKQSLNPKGLTPAQATQTRKAAVQMLATQVTLAGGLGMPFAAAGLAALQKLFPEQNLEELAREGLKQFVGDDTATGNLLSSVLLQGLPSALDQAPDMGSRFALGGVMGVSPYGEMSLSKLIGPTASMFTNLLKATQSAVQGDAPKTVEQLLPRGPLRIWKALEQGNSFTSPASGRTLMNDLSPAERLGRLVGFTPARVARLQDAQRLERVSSDAENAKQKHWLADQIPLLDAGEDQRVRQNIVQRSQETGGLRSPKELSTALSREYESNKLPVDARRAVGSRSTLQTAKALQGVLGKQTEGPSYMDRIALQQQIASRLGFGMPSGGSVRRAATLDNLIQQFPFLTTPQAGVLADRHARASADLQSLGLSGIGGYQ